MRFDKHIQTILETLKPALDGEREVYGIRITYDFLDGVGDDEDFHRFNEDEIDYFEHALNSGEGILYQGPSLSKALRVIRDIDVQNQLIENTSDLVGTYYILRSETLHQVDDGEVGTSWDSLYVFELSVAYQRQKEIQKDLEAVDTSGFEDLL
jgi:hypothetical protein